MTQPPQPSPEERQEPQEPHRPSVATVEQVVRAQMSTALGGRRGMLEAAVPTLVFTVTFLLTRELRLALALSVGVALVALVARLAQRSSPQFVINALVGIGIGWLFVHLAQRSGGNADDQALAYFLPGLIYNVVYSVLLSVSCLTRWPAVGFMVGSVAGDPLEWHRDRQVVRLCTRLTWVLAAPCVLRVIVQAPLWLAAKAGALEADTAIGLLGVLKVVMGWPLQVGALALMVGLLARNRTPVAEA